MIYEERLKKLSEKIEKRNFEFTDEDFYILKYEPKVLIHLSDVLDYQMDKNKFKKLFDNIVDNIPYDTLKLLNKEFFITMLNNSRDEGYNISDFFSINEFVNFDKEQFMYYKSFIKNDESLVITNEDLIELLNKNDYKRISNYFIREYEDPQVIERIKREFPFDKYIDSSIGKQLDYLFRDMPYDESLPTIVKIKKFRQYIYSGAKIDGFALLNEFLNKEIDPTSIDNEILTDIFLTIDDNKKDEYFKYLYDRGILSFGKYLVPANLVTEEQFKNDLLKMFQEKPKRLIKYNIERANNTLPNIDIFNFILNDIDLVKQLIKNGDLDYPSKSIYFEQLVPFIVSEMKNNPDKFKENTFYFDIAKYDELFKCIIDNDINFSVSLISAKISNEQLIELINLNDNKINNALVLNYNFINQEDILIKLLRSNLSYSSNFIEKHKNDSKLNIFDNIKILKLFIEMDNKLVDQLFTNSQTEKYTENTFIALNDYLIQKYHLNRENLLKLHDLVGSSIIKYLDDFNINTIINMDGESFDKLIELFRIDNFEMKDIEGFYDSIKQYLYAKNNPHVIEVFSNILHSIDAKTTFHRDVIDLLAAYLDEKFYLINQDNKLFSKYSKDSSLDLLNFIIKKLEDTNTENKLYYKDMLHIITEYYINQRRNNFTKTYNLASEVNLKYSIDKNKNIDRLAKFILENKYYSNDSYRIMFNNKICKLGISEEIINNCIRMYLGYNVSNVSEDQYSKIKKNVGLVARVTKEIYYLYESEGLITEKLINMADQEEKLKRDYQIDESKSIIEILSLLNIDLVKSNLLSDENAYQSLIEIMKKRKLPFIPKSLEEYLIKNDLIYDLAAYINYFYIINQNYQKNTVDKNQIPSYASIVTSSTAFSSMSNIYSAILGNTDSVLIATNPASNAAFTKTASNVRLNEAVELTKKLFERTTVTIPTSNEIYSDGKKQIRIIIGNFTNQSNLTHGERTGSCMRIGGVGEKLFYFCIKNENGFHIRFEDPETGEYISRVSGFRNGNTVFLNELRYSCDYDKYSDSELFEFCKQAALKLINQSKDSIVPIENVVIHPEYVAIGLKTTHLDKENIKEGFESFYSDVGQDAVVLATTNEPFAPLNFDKTNIPIYMPAREIPYQENSIKDLSSMICRVDAVKKYLKCDNYHFIPIKTFETGIKYGFANQDWYIYVDINNQIHEDFIDIDCRAKLELDEAREKIYEYLAKKESRHGL